MVHLQQDIPKTGGATCPVSVSSGVPEHDMLPARRREIWGTVGSVELMINKSEECLMH